MYVITRVYETKPGKARLAATLAAKICEVYEDAGQRGQVTVSFNGGTLPGETNRAYMRWVAEKIESPYRGENTLPDTSEFGSQLAEATVRNWIEFEDLLSPDKYQES
jgi:hypothetical protein